MEETKYDILNEFEHNIMLIQEVFGTSGSTDNLQINALCEYLFIMITLVLIRLIIFLKI